jgi:hypothetical protein
MRWLRKFRDRGGDEASEPAAGEAPECMHVTLIPRWESADDIGKEDRASKYTCDTCGAEFARADAQELRRTEAERVKRHLAG